MIKITLRNADGASKTRRLVRSSGLLAACLGLIALFLHICWAVPLGAFAPVHASSAPRAGAAPVVAEVQAEPHTCGLHAMRSMYRSFGLDPDGYKLRARLGVDNPGTMLDKESTGTLQPDLYRVLDQDGFTFESDFSETRDLAGLHAHLEGGKPVMALIQRPETEGLHWIVLSGYDAAREGYTVYDSLKKGPQTERADDAWQGRMLGTIMVRARTSGESQRSPWVLHAIGVRDMLHTHERSSDVLSGGRGELS